MNLTDGDARLMKGRQGIIAGYNGQLMVAPLTKEAGHGMLVTAAEITQDAHDQGQLLAVIQAAAETTERVPELTLADGGYLSGRSLADCDAAGVRVAIPDGHLHPGAPYHRDRFVYDGSSDSFTCPEGQQLAFSYVRRKAGVEPVRVYRSRGPVCQGCPAFGRCTTSAKRGRSIELSAHDAVLQAHHAWMQTTEAKAAYALRKCLVEPSIGIMKEQQGARHFLLRGVANVGAEWSLFGIGFNLRSLWRVFRHQGLCSSAAALLAA